MSDGFYYEDWYGDAIKLRIKEAEYFLEEHKIACGPPCVNFFKAIAMADAALFAIVSLKDMVDGEKKDLVENDGCFSLLKCIRNLTAHHKVWPNRTNLLRSSSIKENLTEESVGFFCTPFKLDEELEWLMSHNKANKKSAERARFFLKPYIENTKTPFYLSEIMQAGISLVKKNVA